MKVRIDKDHQVQNSAEPEQTAWRIIHGEYKRNTASLKEKYARELNREIISKQSKDSYSLANIFKNIAEANIGLARAVDTNQSLKLYHYNDGAIACQYTLKLTNDQKVQQDTYKILDKIQTDMVQFSGGDASKVRALNSKEDIEILSNRKELQDIRDQTSQSLEQIKKYKILKNDERYIQESARVFKDIASSMQQYLGVLYKSAEDIVGLPPCDYTVIGLGSMALRQMTPYSDLECAILTANEDYKQHANPIIRDYFRNLSHLVHFKIINLGETIIPTSAYNINLSEFVSPAVNFDLGGKTPLGRIEKDKPYELIQTVDGMLSYLQNPGKTTDHIDKNLASILQKVCFIHGNKELAKSYQEQAQAQDFLLSLNDNGRPNHEERAIKALSEGVEEIDYTKPTVQPKKIEGNLKQFSFDANKAQGKLFDVKQEIYRMPDRFVYNLGLIYGVQEDSSWDTIDKLYEQGIINAGGATNLKKALSFATNLRLKTYSHYGYQKDTMDFAKAYEAPTDLQSQKVEQELATVFKLNPEDLQEDGALFEYYYTALSLRNSLEKFCELKDLDSRKEEFFKNNIFYSDDVGTKAQINSRLLRYAKALEYQLEELEELKIKKQDLISNNADLTNINLKIASSLDNIGYTYQGLGDHNKALECREKELDILQLLGNSRLNIAKTLGNIGMTYQFLGLHENALKYKIQALQTLLAKNPGDKKIILDIATTRNNIGMTHLDLGRYVEALECINKALKVRKELLDSDHLDIATSLNNIAVSYGGLSNHQQALECQLEGLNIFQKSLGSDHPYVAIILSNIGITYSKLSAHKEALEYKIQALEITKKSLGSDHPYIAKAFNNIAVSYGYLLNYKEALNYYIQASEIFKQVLGNEHHALAISLNNIGNTYSDANDHRKALEYKLQALNIFQKSLGHNHVDTIACKYKISQEYCHLGMYKEALAELAGILSIYKKSNQKDKIVQYSNEISIIKKVKGLYDVSNKLLEDNTIVQAKNAQEMPQVISQLITVRKQFEACSDPIKSDVIDRKILQTLDLLIKAQTSLYQNSTKNKLAIRKQLNDYQKEYDELKESIEDKQLKLQEIEEYLAEQKQIRDEQREIESAHNALSMLETDSAFEELPENTELVSLTGENHNEYEALNLN